MQGSNFIISPTAVLNKLTNNLKATVVVIILIIVNNLDSGLLAYLYYEKIHLVHYFIKTITGSCTFIPYKEHINSKHHMRQSYISVVFFNSLVQKRVYVKSLSHKKRKTGREHHKKLSNQRHSYRIHKQVT